MRAIVTALAVLLAGCSGDDATPTSSSSSSGSSSGSSSDAVEVRRFEQAGLAFLVEATTRAPAVVYATAEAGNHRVTTPKTPAVGTAHEILLLGLRSAQRYDVTVVAVAGDGKESTVATTEIDTPSLPDDFPSITVEVDAERASEGLTMFDVFPLGGEGPSEPRRSYLVALDGEGEVVWWYSNPTALTDVSVTPRGTLLVSVDDVAIREIDLFGRTVRELGGNVAFDLGGDLLGNSYTTDDTERISIDSTHHDVQELPDGNLLTLSTELLEHDAQTGTQLCPDLPVTKYTGDVVVELTPAGEVVHQWSLADVLDPVARPGTELCVAANPIAPPTWFYPGSDVRDWTHGNAVLLDEATNTVIVSLRHLNAVFGFRYVADDAGPSGELLWELGPNGTMTLETGEWQYHQHAPELHDDGSLLLYDNGNARPGTGPGLAAPYSRAVLYDVDFASGTASQRWEHRAENADGSPVFAPFLGDADRLDNGNVLITHGGQLGVGGFAYARIIEVVPIGSSGGDIVRDISVGDREAAAGWAVYRADHLPSLYFEGLGSS